MDLGLEIWGGVDQRMVNATISCNFFPLVFFDFSEAPLLKSVKMAKNEEISTKLAIPSFRIGIFSNYSC